MHSCKETKERITELLLDEADSTPDTTLSAELLKCGDCRNEFATLKATLRMTKRSREQSAPTEAYWNTYHAKLRYNLVHANSTDESHRPSLVARFFNFSIPVPAPVALALMLVVGAGLMIESLRLLLKTDVGITTTNVVSSRLVLARAKYNTVEQRAEFYESVLQRLRAVPGIQAAGAVNALPLDAAGTIGLRIAAMDGPQDEEHAQSAAMLSASSGYFKTLGVQLMGDDLPDTRDTSRHVAVINRTLAEKLWPGKNPIGRRFGWGNMQFAVIGLVGDIRTRSLERAPVGQMYTPIVDGPQSYGAIVVRGSGDAPHLLADLRNAVRAVDASQPLYEMRAMDDVVAQSVAPRRTNTVLLGTFGILAMVLAAVGVYAVLSYGVAQRTREIGVRMALGARREDVIALVARQGLVLAAIGIALGLAGAFALSKTMSSMLFAVHPRDVRIFAVAPITLAIVAIVATLAPALRATRVDPMSALRAE